MDDKVFETPLRTRLWRVKESELARTVLAIIDLYSNAKNLIKELTSESFNWDKDKDKKEEFIKIFIENISDNRFDFIKNTWTQS